MLQRLTRSIGKRLAAIGGPAEQEPRLDELLAAFHALSSDEQWCVVQLMRRVRDAAVVEVEE